MINCTVNGRTRPVDSGLKTWGDLLAWLERGEGEGRPIVSAVRFQGVDQPSFRKASACRRPLAEIASVDVELDTAAELVASAAASVLDGLGPLSLAAQATADAFRRHDLAPAHRALAEFVGTFHALTLVTSAIDGLVMGTLFDAAARAFLARLEGRFEELIECAGAEDWISVADVLEYEIVELLPEWAALLRDVGRATAVRRVS